ncbi:hypothetical protein WICPIJ_006282 [Wickerhamomyces pijperi]|uniref:Aminotransferase n=1 Tax=Wickerhamomyces pijperi TaxID=599730 RepID=A0A9P8Q2J4_WICPI|nr:hypothetical protein WICPIJ_006282 [Wickerhamomyces pijperi]
MSSTILQNALHPIPVAVRGKGINITIIDPETGLERELIDANSGAAVSSVGHGDEEIKEAMRKAVDNLIYTFPIVAGNTASEKLGKFILDQAPGAFASALFTGSGSESVENAMKIMRKYHIENGEPQRVKFICRRQAYHGYTLGTLAISDNNKKVGMDEITLPKEQCPRVSQVYPYRNRKDGETLDQYSARLVQELDDTFKAAGPDTVIGFIAETVTGSTFGCQVPPPGYLDGCRDVCHKYGALFYLDEVMSGCGRMGSFHGWSRYMTGPGPDIQTNGKTLGAGYVTIAAVLIGNRIMDLFKAKKTVIQGAQTYHAHSFNCEVALAVQQKVKRDNLIGNIDTVGKYIGEKLRELQNETPFIGEVRGDGGFWGVEFVKDKATKEPFSPETKFGYKFMTKLFQKGCYSLTLDGTIDGVNGDHTILSPAFTITKEEVDTIVRLMGETLKELESEVEY